MKKPDRHVKAIFFDLWNSTITGAGEESISAWYRDVTGTESFAFNREECMKISEEEPRGFLLEFLSRLNDSFSLRLLLSVKDSNSTRSTQLVENFRRRVVKDCASIRWLPGALEILDTLKDNFITVGISNIWGYQKPYFKKTLKIDRHFQHVFLSSDYGITKIDLIKKAFSDLRLRPEEVLMVGDRYDNDIMPAIGLGMQALRINPLEINDPAQFLGDMKRAVGSRKGTELKLRERTPGKCLFIIPPYYKMFRSHNNRINLGIATLVEICGQAGIEARVFHADGDSSEEYPTRYQILLNSFDFYENLDNHPVFEEVREFVRDYGPDVVVITSGDMVNSFTDTGCWQVSLRVAKETRIGAPDAYIVSYGPEFGKPMGDFDSGIICEAEGEFLGILKKRPRGVLQPRPALESEIDGAPVFRKERFVQDLSPKGFDVTYWRRGCLGRCQFCRVAEKSGGMEKFRSVEKLAEDLSYRYNVLGLRNFYFVDPNFTSRKDKVVEFCEKVAPAFPAMTWRAESRFDTLSKDIVPRLKGAGCTHLKLGLENALGEDHQTPGKRISLAKVREKIQFIHDHGLKCVVYIMLGGFWYTERDYEMMFDNTVGLGADGYTVSLTTPYVGTSIGITQEEWDRWGFTGSHLDIRLVDYWRIPTGIVEKFFDLELRKGREDGDIRKFTAAHVK